MKKNLQSVPSFEWYWTLNSLDPLIVNAQIVVFEFTFLFRQAHSINQEVVASWVDCQMLSTLWMQYRKTTANCATSNELSTEQKQFTMASSNSSKYFASGFGCLLSVVAQHHKVRSRVHKSLQWTRTATRWTALIVDTVRVPTNNCGLWQSPRSQWGGRGDVGEENSLGGFQRVTSEFGRVS